MSGGVAPGGKILRFFRGLGMREISAWQAGKDSLHNPFRTCWPLAGTFVLAFRKPDTTGDHSFQDIRMDSSKGREAVILEGCGQGSFGLPDDLDPVQDCRRPRRNESFINGLIAWPA